MSAFQCSSTTCRDMTFNSWIIVRAEQKNTLGMAFRAAPVAHREHIVCDAITANVEVLVRVGKGDASQVQLAPAHRHAPHHRHQPHHTRPFYKGTCNPQCEDMQQGYDQLAVQVSLCSQLQAIRQKHHKF